MPYWTALKHCGCALAAVSTDAYSDYNRAKLAKFIVLMMDMENVTLGLVETAPEMYHKPCRHEAQQLELVMADSSLTYEMGQWYRNGQRVAWGEYNELDRIGQASPDFKAAAEARHKERYPEKPAHRPAKAAKGATMPDTDKLIKPADNGHGNDPTIEAEKKAEAAAVTMTVTTTTVPA